MAGKADIKAGRAYVELLLNDSKFVKGLKSASKTLKNFGTGFAAVGAGITAVGAGVLAPLLKMTDMFLESSDALDKMRQRTGISVSALSELGHAAEQSGTSLEVVEKGVARMQKGLTEAANGSKSAAESFSELGLNARELAKLSPEEQFDQVAHAIGAIEDPTRRAGMAMKVFGKSGAQLLPMIEDMDALREEARAMGFTMDDEAAASAVKLGDMIANLVKTVKFAALNIGSALMPAIESIVIPIQTVGTKILFWIKENKQLVVTIAKVAAGLFAAGTVIAAIGTGIVGLGFVLGGIATTIATIGTVIGAILSPVGLAITGIVALGAALVAGAAYWVRFTESGQNALAGIMAFLGPFLDTFKATWQGIADTIATGDLGGAVEIALAGIKVVFLQGVASLASAVGGVWGDFIGTLGTQIASGDFVGAWNTAWLQMKLVAMTGVNGILDIWSGMKFVVLTTLDSLTTSMKIGMSNVWSFIIQAWHGSIGTIKAMLWDLLAWWADKHADMFELIGLDSSGFRNLEKIATDGARSARATRDAAMSQEEQTRLGTNAELNRQHGQFVAERQGILASEVGGRMGATDALRAEIAANNARAGVAPGGGSNAAADAAEQAAKELEDLTKQAAAAREEQSKRQAEVKDERENALAGVPSSAAMKAQSIVTFSAAALAAQGQGMAGPVEEQKKTNKKLDKLISVVDGGIA